MENLVTIRSRHVWINDAYMPAAVTFNAASGRIEKVDADADMQGENALPSADLYIYPGWIDCHTNAGMQGPGGDRLTDVNDPYHFDTPYYRAIDAANMYDSDFAAAAKEGITSVAVMPGPSAVVGGQVGVISAWSDSPFGRILCENAGMTTALGRRPILAANAAGISPQTKMAVLAMLRESLLSAKGKAHETDSDLGAEGWRPVLDGRKPMRVICHREDDIIRAISLAREMDVRLVLDRATSACLTIDAIRLGCEAVVCPNTILRVPQILEERNATEHYAADLMKAGIPVALSTAFPECAWPALRMQMCECLCQGAPYEAVVHSVTKIPAAVLGMEAEIGHIAEGNRADFAIWSAPFEHFDACVVQTIINGKWLGGQLT